MITGATDGLGRALAERLAAIGMAVHIHGRSADKLARAHEEIVAATGNERVFTHRADLASLAEVRALADEVGALDALHLLINNAGIGSGLPDSPDREESRDGIELRFAVNYLAGFALTEPLLPLLERSAPARIVMVASLGQAALDFDDPLLERSYYEGRRAYAQSKLAQITYANELAARLAGTGVTVNSISPGVILTAGVEGWFRKLSEQFGWGTEWPEIEKRAIAALAPNHIGRAGRPEDVAHAVMYLASPKGGFVTGTDMMVSGGLA